MRVAATSAAHVDAESPHRTPGAPRAVPIDSTGRLVAILCYHGISDDPHASPRTVSPQFLRHQIESCRRAGWTFMSLGDLVAKRSHPDKLPPRVMVLTFDGGFESFHDDALPILRETNVPAAVAVTTSWIDHAPPGTPPLMSWSELKTLRRDGIDVMSLTHNLDRSEACDPQLDWAPAAVTRRYIPREQRYETVEEYRSRIGVDLASSQRALRAKVGRAATALAWPSGADNDLVRGLARRSGFRATLVLSDRTVSADDLHEGRLPRITVTRDMRFEGSSWLRAGDAAVRAVEIDLDDFYDSEPMVFRARVDQLVRRVTSMGATHAFIATCANPEGCGKLREAYVMNTQMRVRGDAWTHLASRLSEAGVSVWARVPTMNLTWAWTQHPDWRIRHDAARAVDSVEASDSARASTAVANAAPVTADLQALPGIAVSSWPTRLSPELPGVRHAAAAFVADIAAYAPIDGILFDDDAFMSPDEHLSSRARADAAAKAQAIDQLLAECRAAARAWRPECAFGRRIDAAVVQTNGVHPALAQDYDGIVHDNDVTVVEAYPCMNGKCGAGDAWIETVGRRAFGRGADVAPTHPVIVELQTYDWLRESWLTPKAMSGMAAAVRRSGVPGLAVCPVSTREGDIPTGVLDASIPAMASDDAGR